jgi:hypothetical protein
MNGDCGDVRRWEESGGRKNNKRKGSARAGVEAGRDDSVIILLHISQSR